MVVLSLLTLLLVITVFNLMIAVHEIGHFLAARWRGLVIEEFGIWFGKPLWRKKIGGIWYSLGSIPLGGFVKLPQLVAMETVEGKSEAAREQLPSAPPFSKIIVAFAGPLFSFLLAVIFALVVWRVGRPVSESEKTTVIGYVLPDSPAKAAHLEAGDRILSIDGHQVNRWLGMGQDSVTWRIVASEGETIDLRVQRGDQILDAHPKPVIPPTKPWNRRAFRQLQMIAAETPLIHAVEKGGPADAAGFQADDQILAVNNERVYSWEGLEDYLLKDSGQAAKFTVLRHGRKVETGPLIQRDAIVAGVQEDSPAAAAGLLPGDRIKAIDHQPFVSLEKFTSLIRGAHGQALLFDVQREERPLGDWERWAVALHLRPPVAAGARRFAASISPLAVEGEPAPHIGVQWGVDLGWTPDARGLTQLDYPTPGDQIRKAATSILDTIGAVTSRKSAIGFQHMSGPVMMLRAYYSFFQIKDGWRLALWFSVLLNVNLAILNLLPIPPLDGSHITLAAIEGIRRRPVNVRFVEYVQTACTVVIIGFMLYIFFFDVQDLFPGGRLTKFRPAPVTPAASSNR